MITFGNSHGLDFLTHVQADLGILDEECGGEPCLPEDISHYDKSGQLLSSQRALFPRKQKENVYDPTDPEGWDLEERHPWRGDVY